MALAVFATLSWVSLIPSLVGIRINTSPSLPLGLYLVTDKDSNLVEFCPPEPFASLALRRGYRSSGNCPDGGAPLLKPVVARAGDVVEFNSCGVFVTGKLLSNSASLKFDTQGRPLQHWPFGRYKLAFGTVWVTSSYNQRSFDSRYLGPISVDRIRARLTAAFTLPAN